MATWRDVAGYTHYAVRSDGAKWVNGQRDDTADTSWMDMTGGVLTLQAGVYDELLVVPYVVDEAQIQAWYELRAPFYDPTPVIDADGQTIVAADNHAVIDRRGLTVNDGIQDRVAVGDISGRPWGSGVLAQGTYGLWGELAGLYLRGYTRLLMIASGLDEEIVDLSGFPNLANPEVIVLPKELVSYSPERATLSHLYVDAVRLDATRWRLKAKTLVKGTTVDWGSRGNQRSYWEHVRPVNADPINGRKGVWTNFLICRPTWWVSSLGGGLYTARLWMDITNEFNANGDPINWQTIRTFSRSSGGSGTLNWDTSVPYGQWAMRVRGEGGGSVLATYAETGLAASGYRTGDTYLRVDGTVITDPDPGNVPSGMSVVYLVVDQG